MFDQKPSHCQSNRMKEWLSEALGRDEKATSSRAVHVQLCHAARVIPVAASG